MPGEAIEDEQDKRELEDNHLLIMCYFMVRTHKGLPFQEIFPRDAAAPCSNKQNGPKNGLTRYSLCKETNPVSPVTKKSSNRCQLALVYYIR